MSIEIKDFLDRTAQRNGYVRHTFEDRKIPGDFNDVCIMPMFCGHRHLFAASSFLLKRYKEEMKGSKYFILLSWPGYRSLFPYVDEFWSPGEVEFCKKLWKGCSGFKNKSEAYATAMLNLNESFREVIKPEVLTEFYDNGIKQAFWDRFRNVKVFLPQVSSHAVLGKDFGRELGARSGFKVVVIPTQTVECWKFGRVSNEPVSRDFWVSLVKYMRNKGFVPVVVRSFNTYDLSQDTFDDAIHLADLDVGKLMAAIRSAGCLLDVFNGTSRLAIAARTPYLCCDERSRYYNSHEYEIDDLCGGDIPRNYIYSFSTVCQMPAVHWEQSLFRQIIMKLNDFLPTLDRDTWPTTTEANRIAPYDSVRKLRRRRLGTKLLKIIRD